MANEKIIIDIDGRAKGAKNAIKGIDKEIFKAQKKADRLKSTMSGLKFAGAAAFATIGATIGVSLKKFAKFDNELRGVKTLLDEGSFGAKGLEEGFADMRKGILRLGATAPVAIESLNKSLFDTVSAGVAAGDAVKFVGTAAKLATAGITDVSIATDGLTSALNAYELKAGAAEEIASKFFLAQKAGKTTIAELSSGFGIAGASASGFGVTLDELLGAVSAVTIAGVKTNSAYTGLNALLTGISKPTADAAKEAKKLGIEFNTTALRSKGLLKFLTDLKNANGFTKQSVEKLFGSIEARNIAFSLTGAQADIFANNVENLGNKQKALNTFTAGYGVQAAGAASQMSIFNNKVSALSITLGEELAPAMMELLKVGTLIIAEVFNIGETPFESGLASLKEKYDQTKVKMGELILQKKKMDSHFAAGRVNKEVYTARLAFLDAELTKLKEIQKVVPGSTAGGAPISAGGGNDRKLKIEQDFQDRLKEMRDAVKEGQILDDENDLLTLQSKLDVEAELKNISMAKDLATNGDLSNAKAKINELELKKYVKHLQTKQKFEQQFSQQYVGLAQQTAGLITSIYGQETVASFLIAKGAAAAQIFLDKAKADMAATFQSRMLMPGLSEAYLAKSLLVNKISAGVALATVAAQSIQGFAQGGMIEGGTAGRDSVRFMGQRNEVIVPPKTTFEDLITAGRAFTEGGEGGQQVEVKLTLNDNLIDFVEAEINQRQAIGVS